jgi:hypothetical protein
MVSVFQLNNETGGGLAERYQSTSAGYGMKVTKQRYKIDACALVLCKLI